MNLKIAVIIVILFTLAWPSAGHDPLFGFSSQCFNRASSRCLKEIGQFTAPFDPQRFEQSIPLFHLSPV